MNQKMDLLPEAIDLAKGYAKERNQSTSAQIRQRFYLLYEVQKYMPIAIWRRQDEQRALSFKQKSLTSANDLL